LFGSEWVSGPKKRLIEIVLKGMSGPITVRKKPYDGVMPAHAFLSDEQIAEILTHVRTRISHGGSPVSSEEVQLVRAAISAESK
jgi:mono/diheme cytochrome c family protein